MTTIFCFTSTGNSLVIAKQLAERTGGEVISMTKEVAVCDDKKIGFVFPAYFWDIPKIVERFVRKLEITNPDVYVFVVVTYGGRIHGVTGIFKRWLSKKGIVLNYSSKIKTVENYIPMYKVNNSDGIHVKVRNDIDIIADDINDNKMNKAEMVTPVNPFMRYFFPGKSADCDKNFVVSDACVDCEICAKVCPMSNISYSEQRPVFHHNCEHCLACIHMCPEEAIQWKKKTIGKERYRNPNVKLSELEDLINGEEVRK